MYWKYFDACGNFYLMISYYVLNKCFSQPRHQCSPIPTNTCGQPFVYRSSNSVQFSSSMLLVVMVRPPRVTSLSDGLGSRKLPNRDQQMLRVKVPRRVRENPPCSLKTDRILMAVVSGFRESWWQDPCKKW